jgi:hypothetical protein
MENKSPEIQNKLIHVAIVYMRPNGRYMLFLRRKEANLLVWYEENGNNEEKETSVRAQTIEEAIRLGRSHWKNHAFRTLTCGFRYTLPERDEHGMNALFYQMAASYSSSNGIYFDDELGHNCFVQAASLEARNLLNTLSLQKKI